MPAQILTVDASDLRRFFFHVDGDSVTFGFDPDKPDGAIRNLRIKGIRCELDVSDAPVTVKAHEAGGRLSEHLLISDEELRVGSSKLRILPTLDEAEEAESPASDVARQLVVVNGADFGRVFPIVEGGVTRVGKDAKSSHISLNDLYVAHIHCQLEAAGNRVFVSHLDGSGGTFINRQKIGGRTEIQVGDIMRVGNSHLRFELAEAKPTAESEPVADMWSNEEPTHHHREKKMAVAVAPPPPAPPSRVVREPSPLEKAMQLENQTFGHFQIGELLGRGHMSVVFRALDLKTNQTVALKVLSPEFPKSDAEIQNLGRVFKVAPTLRDSHLVTLLGVGRCGQFTWISREYVEGESLQELLNRSADEGKSSWKKACRVGAHVGAALDFLHQHKIVHANLTPRNVLIRGEDNTAKVADALLAQALQGSHLHKETHGKKRHAEAAYLAPEQLIGTAAPDFRSDQYALGVLCYELAVGQPPFVGSTIEELRMKIIAGAVARPSRRQKDIPPPFESAILKLLSRDPEARFHEVGEFLDIVEPILMMHDIK